MIVHLDNGNQVQITPDLEWFQDFLAGLELANGHNAWFGDDNTLIPLHRVTYVQETL